jgi:glycosyltransferase involved in cell wall biosynthesis
VSDRRALIASTYTIADPPTNNICQTLLSSGYAVEVVQPGYGKTVVVTGIRGVVHRESKRIELPRLLRPLCGPVNASRYQKLIRQQIETNRPQLVVTTHLNDLAALPWPPKRYDYILASSILDVPVIRDAGRLDRILQKKAWKRLQQAMVVWASDRYKAEFVREFGELDSTPLICHNAPKTDYLSEPTWPRDGWLRAELRKQGASLGETSGCIVLRAGAVGEYGGIEETLNALGDLPENVVFLMMGRPYPGYRKQIETWIAERGLAQRVFLWDRPSDDLWKKALLGADVGHLVHGPFPEGKWQRLYNANSSLSNNRLFQYLAAGLPVLAYDDPRMNDIYCEVPAFRVCRLASLAEDLKRNIGELACNARIRKSVGMAGRELHVNKYNWNLEFNPVIERIATMFSPVGK